MFIFFTTEVQLTYNVIGFRLTTQQSDSSTHDSALPMVSTVPSVTTHRDSSITDYAPQAVLLISVTYLLYN